MAARSSETPLKVTLSVRVPVQSARAVRRLAISNNTSVSDVVAQAIEKLVARERKVMVEGASA